MSNPLLQAIQNGTAPKMVKLAAAKGALPLPPEILLEAQVRMTRDADEEVCTAAREGIRNYKTEDLLSVVENRKTAPLVMDYCAENYFHVATIMEKILTNPTTHSTTFALVADRVSQSLAELMIANQVRIIEHPAILQRLRNNPHLSPGNQARLEEIERDFLAAEQFVASVGLAPGPVPAPPEPAEIVPEAAAVELIAEPVPPGELPPEAVAYIEELADGDQDKMSVFQRIAQMSVSNKIKVALLGNREERALLVRDSNRLVSTSVLSSPKLTESEVETFSMMRNVSDEVLRLIGNKREWIKSYKISINLVKNPRAPLAITMTLLNRLSAKDVKMLEKDRTIPEALRQQARRLASRRMT